MEEVLKEIEASIIDGRINNEEAKILLEDIQRTLEVEEYCGDIALKGQLLAAVSTLLKLV